MERLTYEQRCFIWASGHYLSEEVADDFFDNEIEDQFEICEQNAWEPFENYRGKDIHGWIYQLAYDIQNGLFPMKGDSYDQGEEV